MKINEEMFAIKLYELEQQYRIMQGRIRLCGRLNGPELEQELTRARQEYRDTALSLQESVKGCRSPAAAQLAGAQLEFAKRLEELWDGGRLEKALHTEKNCPAEERAEAAALYAEYAIDCAVQSMQFALIAALYAAGRQLDAENRKGDPQP